MTTGATGQLGLALPVQGELSGTWGDTVNNGITQYTNIAIAGTLTLTGDGAVTLANTTGDASASNITSTLAGAGTVTAQFAIVRVSGTTTTKVITGPSYSKTYVVDNASSYAVTFKASGQTGVSIAAAEKVTVVFNGTDYIKIAGTIANAAGSNTQIQFNNGGLFGASANLTWDGTTLSSTQINITGQGTLRLQDTTGGEYVAHRAPSALGASYTLTWPADDGTVGQALITDGSGVLSWSTSASGDVYGPASSTDNAVARFDGTTGKLIQDSVVLIGDTGAVTGVTDLTASGSVTLSGGTANGVTYLNGSKVLTSGSALTFDGTNLTAVGSLVAQRTGGVSQYARISNTGGTATFISDNQASSAYTGFVFQGLSTASGTPVDYLNLTSTSLYTASGINVGIGTSSPSTKLDVVGASAGSTVSTFTSNETGTTTSLAVFQRSGGAVAAAIKYNATNSPLTIDFGTTTSHALTFLTANTERMRITSAGDVGIGTSSPNKLLTLYSSTNDVEVLRINVNGGAGGVQAKADIGFGYYDGVTEANAAIGFEEYGTSSSGGNLLFKTRPDGASESTRPTERARIDSSGNFGIGTTSPVQRLDVVSSSTDVFQAIRSTSSSPTNVALRLQDATTGTSNGDGAYLGRASSINYLWTYENEPWVFGTNATERARIDSSGNLGLGVTPSAWGGGYVAAQIGSASIFSLAGGSGGYFIGNGYFNGSAYVYQNTASSTRYEMVSGQHAWSIAPSGTAGTGISFTQAMTLDASGNLGVGTTSPVAKLQIKGTGTSGQVTSSFILENGSSGTAGMDITGAAGSSYLRLLYGGGPSTGTNTLTETMRVGLEGASAGVQQIKFAATQVASSDANTLDDYEEGTWTPTDASGAGLSFTTSDSFYTKIGNVVYVSCSITFPSTSSTESIRFGGLPFTVKNGSNNAYAASISQTNTGRTDIFNYLRNNTQIGVGTNGNVDVTNATYSTKFISLSGFYFV